MFPGHLAPRILLSTLQRRAHPQPLKWHWTLRLEGWDSPGTIHEPGFCDRLAYVYSDRWWTICNKASVSQYLQIHGTQHDPHRQEHLHTRLPMGRDSSLGRSPGPLKLSVLQAREANVLCYLTTLYRDHNTSLVKCLLKKQHPWSFKPAKTLCQENRYCHRNIDHSRYKIKLDYAHRVWWRGQPWEYKICISIWTS